MDTKSACGAIVGDTDVELSRKKHGERRKTVPE